MQKLERALRRIAVWLFALMVYCFAVVIGYAILSGAMWPEASGANVQVNADLTLDISNSMDGYVMGKVGPNGNYYKLRVTKDGYQLMYDILADGQYITFPLQLGNGNYSFELFRNVGGSKYAQAGAVTVPVMLENAYAPFLLPNQYVNYNENSDAVRISEEICAGLTTDAEKLEAVRNYIRSNYTYDNNKAATVAAGTLPSIDYLLQNRMGICQDIAATVACMLRVQGIPTQLVIGYANKYYHAWNNVLIDGQFQLVDVTAELNSAYVGVTYTTERYY